jgi:ribosome-associated toxin RatA of RatAB toxin-antitoxin module
MTTAMRIRSPIPSAGAVARGPLIMTAGRPFLLIAVLCALGAVSPFAAEDDAKAEPIVSVGQQNGVYSVSARFHVPQSPAVVRDVLTDYEQIPRFMPDIKTSTVRERAPGRVVVEQEAVSRLLMFSKRVHLVLEIVEEADALRFHDRSGRSFTYYQGSWRLSDHSGGTTVVYELSAEPAFDVPEAILKRLLRRDSARMIQSLRQEMAARSAGAPVHTRP